MYNSFFYIVVINELHFVNIASLEFQSLWTWDVMEPAMTSEGKESVKELKPICGPVPFPDYSCEEPTTITIKLKDIETTWQYQQKLVKESVSTVKKQLSEESLSWHSIESMFDESLNPKKTQGRIVNLDLDIVTEPTRETIKMKSILTTKKKVTEEFTPFNLLESIFDSKLDTQKAPEKITYSDSDIVTEPSRETVKFKSISATKKKVSEEFTPWNSIESIFDTKLDTKKSPEKVINSDLDIITEPSREKIKFKSILATKKKVSEESTPWHSIESMFETMLDAKKPQEKVIHSDSDVATKPTREAFESIFGSILDTEKNKTKVINSDSDIVIEPAKETLKPKLTDKTPWHHQQQFLEESIRTTKQKMTSKNQFSEKLTRRHSIGGISDKSLDKTKTEVIDADSNVVTEPSRKTMHPRTDTTAWKSEEKVVEEELSEYIEEVPTSWHSIENQYDTTLEKERKKKGLMRPKFLLWGETTMESVKPMYLASLPTYDITVNRNYSITTRKDEIKLADESTTSNPEEQESTSADLNENQNNKKIGTKNAQKQIIRPYSVIWSQKTRRIPNLKNLPQSSTQKKTKEEKSRSVAQPINSAIFSTGIVNTTQAASSTFSSYLSTQHLPQFESILEDFLRLNASLITKPSVSVTSRSIPDQSATFREVPVPRARFVSQQSGRPLKVKRPIFRNGYTREALQYLFTATRIYPEATRSSLTSNSVIHIPQVNDRFRALRTLPEFASLPDSKEIKLIVGAPKMQNLSKNIPKSRTYPP